MFCETLAKALFFSGGLMGKLYQVAPPCTKVHQLWHNASSAWNAYTTEGVETVESVQRASSQICLNDYQRSTIVSSLINKLNWCSLQEQRTLTDFSFCFFLKI